MEKNNTNTSEYYDNQKTFIEKYLEWSRKMCGYSGACIGGIVAIAVIEDSKYMNLKDVLEGSSVDKLSASGFTVFSAGLGATLGYYLGPVIPPILLGTLVYYARKMQ